MRSIITIGILLLLTACGNKAKEEVADAIDMAKDYLTHHKCDEAINLLEDIGRQSNDPIYLMTLASAYSCRGGFDALNFLNNDIHLIGEADPADFMQALVTLSTASEDTTDSRPYTDMKTALSVLLQSHAGDGTGHTSRVAAFGPRKAGEMGVQVLLLSVVQLGKFLNHFGDVNHTGKKGSLGNNSCFINYTYPAAQAFISDLPPTNACHSNTDGHSDLGGDTEDGRRRLCEGLMLFTNALDVLTNIDLSGNSTMAPLMDVAQKMQEMKDFAINLDASLATLLEMNSQSACESTLSSAGERNNMELIFATLFELGLP